MKGFFSFLLVLFLLPFLISLQDMNLTFNKLNESKNIIIEIEKANYLRTELEQNLDSFFEFFLLKKLKIGNFNSGEIKKDLSNELFNFLNLIEQKNKQTTFLLASQNSINYSNLFNAQSEKPSINSLKSLFKVKPDSFNKKNELTFPFNEKKILFAKINFPNSNQIFLIPLNYSLEVKN